jgi:hypothetical protein
MRKILYCLLLLGACNLAWADVKITFKDIDGATSTMQSNGRKVRINGGRMPGYLLLDSGSGEFFLVDPMSREVVRIAPDQLAVTVDVGSLNVSLKPRGGGEKILGYSTGRFDLLADGLYCGTVYGSSELIAQHEIQRIFRAMRGMHKISRMMVAGFSPMLSDCQRATARLSDLVNTSGFVMRVIDDKGRQVFEVLSLELVATIDPAEYELPADMRVIDMNEKMMAISKQGQQMLQQMPEMQQMMQQMQQSGGQMTPEMQRQMQQMMEQMQQMQQTQ